MISVLLRNWDLIDLFKAPAMLNTLFVYLFGVWNIERFNPLPQGARSIRIKHLCLAKANVTASKAHRSFSYFTWASLSAAANLMVLQCSLLSLSFKMHCDFYHSDLQCCLVVDLVILLRVSFKTESMKWREMESLLKAAHSYDFLSVNN